MIKILATGGTIDSDSVNPYTFSETHLPEMLKQANCTLDIEFDVLMMKDSIDMTPIDRYRILERCENEACDKIVILHGTDTMQDTARLLG